MDLKISADMLTDEFTQRIIMSTYRKPKSALELSQECNIPLPTCHRKLRELVRSGLVSFCDIEMNRHGRLVKQYSCDINGFKLVFEHGQFKIQLRRKGETDTSAEWILIPPVPEPPNTEASQERKTASILTDKDL